MSSTSSSCSNVKALPGNFASASFRASASSRPMIQRSSFSLEPRHAGVLGGFALELDVVRRDAVPHQSCREMHQSRMFSSHRNHVGSMNAGMISSSFDRAASHASAAIAAQFTHH